MENWELGDIRGCMKSETKISCTTGPFLKCQTQKQFFRHLENGFQMLLYVTLAVHKISLWI